MKNIIVKLQNIDFLKTYKYSKKYGKKFREFTVYRYSKIKTKPTSKIEISKKLSFGCVPGNTLLNKWRNSTLLMGNNSKFIINGEHSIFYSSFIQIKDNASLTVGSGGYFNQSIVIKCANEIEIGNNVFIAPGVTIQDHDEHIILKEGYEASKPIVIKDHVWICQKATILKGVTIGEHSVIATGAIVTKDVPPHSLVGGVPAKILDTNIDWK